MKNGRRVFGYGAVTLGAASTIVFLSPIFPIGFEAFLVAALFFGAAYWALAKPTFTGLLRLIAPRIAAPPPEPTDPLLPVKILRLARAHHGTLTVSQTAIELNIPINEAEAGLAACVRASSATEDFDMRRGYALYLFPEFSDPASAPGEE